MSPASRREQVIPDTYTVIDGTGLVAGRLGTVIAKKILNGERVEVVNAEKIIVTGERDRVLDEFRAKRARGKIRKGPYYPRPPHMIYKRIVRGMIPFHQPKGRAAHRLLRCHIGVPAELKDAAPQQPDVARPRNPGPAVSLGDISVALGFSVKEA